jgi:hypothetical protein
MSNNPQSVLDLIAAAVPGWEELRRHGTRGINNVGGLVFEDINLAFPSSQPREIERTCYGIYYSPRGSVPGGLLKLTIGGEVRDFGPGDKITGRIERIDIAPHEQSATIGTARLILLSSPWVDFTSTNAAPPLQPVDLLGNYAAQTFVVINKDTEPAGAAPGDSFDCTGWKTIRVLINTQSGGVGATSFSLIPWVKPGATSTVWHEQGTERIDVPDTSTSGGFYRSVILNVTGRGRMYFEIRDLQVPARTFLGFIVQGIA